MSVRQYVKQQFFVANHNYQKLHMFPKENGQGKKKIKIKIYRYECVLLLLFFHINPLFKLLIIYTHIL